MRIKREKAERIMRDVVKMLGTQTKVAAALQQSKQTFNYWFNHANKVPADQLRLMEELIAAYSTGNDSHHAKVIAQKIRLSSASLLISHLPKVTTISQRAMEAIAFEKEMGERRGRPHGEIRRNLDELKGRTDEMVAKKFGFYSKDRYRQVKHVMQYGTPELIQAMDNQRVTISIAAKLAKLTRSGQQRILQLNKQEIIAELKQTVSDDKKAVLSLTSTSLNNFLFYCLRFYFYLMQYVKDKEQ